MKRTELFQRLMSKYRFSEPVPLDMQKYINSTSKRALKSSLKSLQNYSAPYGAVINTYYAVKKLGAKPSLAIAKAITAAVYAALSATIAAAALYISADHAQKTVTIEPATVKTEIMEPIKKTAAADETQIIKKVKFRIGINRFEANNIDRGTAGKVTDSIKSRLISTLGEDHVLDLRDGRKQTASVNMMLTGSVGKFGDTIFISAKVINVEKSNVLVAVNERVRPGKKINRVCSDIAKKISNEIKK